MLRRCLTEARGLEFASSEFTQKAEHVLVNSAMVRCETETGRAVELHDQSAELLA